MNLMKTKHISHSKSKAKNYNFWFYYQLTLAIISVLLFFTDLHLYLGASEIIPFPPLIFVIFFSLASIPLFSRNFKCLPKNIIIWCCSYVEISAFSYLFISTVNSANNELFFRAFNVLYILTILIIFSGNYTIQIWTRRAICLTVFINIFNLIYETTYPLAFSGLNTSGRASGFYLDPNKCGCSLILALIFGIGVIKPKYRIFYLLIITFGVLLTFSRGALIGLAITTVFFLIKRIIPRSQSIGFLLAIVLLITISSFSSEGLIDKDTVMEFFPNETITGRIESFFDPTSRAADNDTSRIDIVTFGWHKFLSNPIFGQGIGYTQEWGQILPHNMYLLFLVEHGFIGPFILISLIFIVTHEACEDVKNIVIPFALFISIWAVFSHNILEERYQMMMFALSAAMARTSKFQQTSTVPYKGVCK
jgi:O-antigen ligase